MKLMTLLHIYFSFDLEKLFINGKENMNLIKF